MKLADLAQRQLRRKIPELEKALQGHLTEHYLPSLVGWTLMATDGDRRPSLECLNAPANQRQFADYNPHKTRCL